MLHGKKMVLVPHETVEQLQTNVPKPPVPVGSYNKMDNDMEKILKDKQLSEFDKWVQYDSVLQRYLSKLGRQKKDVMLTINEENDADEEYLPISPPVKVEVKREPFDANLESHSKNLKALLLYNILRKSADVQVPEDGSFMLNGERIGLLKDLIAASMTSRIKDVPQGWEKFCAYLKKLNLPVSYVGNKELSQYIKSKPVEKFVIPRKGRSAAKALRWAPYHGPNK
jgi:hypothetical protein